MYPERVDLDRIAYFFDYEVDGALPENTYEPLRRALAAWTDAWRSEPQPALTYWSAPGFLQIHDGRYPGRGGTYTFEGDPRRHLPRMHGPAGDRGRGTGPAAARAARRALSRRRSTSSSVAG